MRGKAVTTRPEDGAGDGVLARRWRERGASSLELALLTPILILVILLVVQFAMVYHARHVALAAAQAGARQARTDERAGWRPRAEQKAESHVRKIAPRVLEGPNAQADGNQNYRWVEVKGTAVKIAPFFTFRVSERSEGPIECYRPDVGSGTSCDGAQP